MKKKKNGKMPFSRCENPHNKTNKQFGWRTKRKISLYETPFSVGDNKKIP